MPGTSHEHRARQLDALRQARDKHPAANNIELARLSGVPAGSITRLLRSLKSAAPRPKKAGVQFRGDGGAAEAVGPNIRTLEDLLRECQVDLSVWEVERHVINKWEVAMKVGSGQKVSALHRPLFQIKAWLRRKQAVIDAKTAAAAFTTALGHLIKPKPVAVRPSNGSLLYEVSIPDLHLGKLAWAEETGHANYDTGIAEKCYRAALDGLLASAPREVGRFLLPIGNDFFNVDSDLKQTTGGTPQDEDGRWQKSFKAGCALAYAAIRRLAETAPVDVVLVSGNHDYQRVFYLGCFLEASFRNAKGITVDNSPTQRKYYSWGQVLLGFTHGDREKQDDLPLIMASERPELWATTTTHEWHLGHEHKEKVRSKCGVTVRVIPSLCPPESWHAGKGYVGGQRQACAFSYDRQGLTGIHVHTVRG